MRKAILACSIAVAQAGLGQVQLCPEGAVWEVSDFGGQLILEQVTGTSTCLGEIFYEGRLAHQIIMDVVGTIPYSGGQIGTYQDTSYISAEGEAVLAWLRSEQPPVWDTTAWYDATVGEHWLYPGFTWADTAYCYASTLPRTVVATGTLNFNGIILRTVTVQMDQSDMGGGTWLPTNTFVERIGLLPDGYLYPCGIICGYFGHTSYWDPQVGAVPLMMGLEAPDHTTAPFMCFSSPEVLTLRAPQALQGDIAIMDLSGRMVLSTRISSDLVSVPWANWGSGVYLIRFVDAISGNSFMRRFVKP